MRLRIFGDCLGLAFVMLLLASCSNKREAAEIINSIAHQFNKNVSTAATLPNNLTSGDCQNQIGGGKATYTGTISTSTVSGILNINLSRSGNGAGAGATTGTGGGTTGTASASQGVDFTCNVQVQYSFDTSGNLVGPGTITSCDNYTCTLNGGSISCSDLQTYLQTYTCATVTQF